MATSQTNGRSPDAEPAPGEIFLKFRVNQETRELCRRLAKWRGKSMSAWIMDHVSAEYAAFLRSNRRKAA